MTRQPNPPSSLIAIETAGAVCGASLWLGGKLAGEINRETSHGHAVLLAPMIQQLAGEHGSSLGHLGCVAATAGPGGFTGIRVGLAMARGLALGARCRAIGIDAFQRLAHSARRGAVVLSGRNLVVIDSRRSELFAALLGPDLGYLGPAFLTDDPATAANTLSATSVVTDHPRAGSWEVGALPVISLLPKASAVGELALLDGGAHCLAPEARYLRAPDVTSSPGKDR